MLTGLGRGAAGLGAFAIKTDGEGDFSIVGDPRMRNGIEDSSSGDLGVANNLGDVLNGGAGDAVFFE